MAIMVTREFWEDLHWGENHHTELLQKYRDQWVAILNKQVVSSGLNLAKVKQEAELKSCRKNISVTYIDSGRFPFQQVL